MRSFLSRHLDSNTSKKIQFSHVGTYNDNNHEGTFSELVSLKRAQILTKLKQNKCLRLFWLNKSENKLWQLTSAQIRISSKHTHLTDSIHLSWYRQNPHVTSSMTHTWSPFEPLSLFFIVYNYTDQGDLLEENVTSEIHKSIINVSCLFGISCPPYWCLEMWA